MKLKYIKALANVGFNVNLRCYMWDEDAASQGKAGACYGFPREAEAKELEEEEEEEEEEEGHAEEEEEEGEEEEEEEEEEEAK